MLAATVRILLNARAAVQGIPLRVGLTGGPGVGKSTLVAQLQRHLVESGVSASVLSLDSFLLPAQLLERHRLLRGTAESYDLDGQRRSLVALTTRRPTAVPEYSHAARDIVGRRVVEPADVVLVEGVSLFLPGRRSGLAVANQCDLTILLKSSPQRQFAQYCTRRYQLWTASRDVQVADWHRFSEVGALLAESAQLWHRINAPLSRALLTISHRCDLIIEMVDEGGSVHPLTRT